MESDEGTKTEEAEEPYLKPFGPLQVGFLPVKAIETELTFLTLQSGDVYFLLVPNLNESSLLLTNIIKRGLEIYFREIAKQIE